MQFLDISTETISTDVQLRNIELLVPEADDDFVDGGAGADTIFGQLGDDILSGGIGDDELFGGEGDDTLDGNRGSNRLEGGDGADVLFTYDDQGDNTIVGGEGGDDQDTLNVANYVTSDGATVVFTGDEAGTATISTITGGSGADSIAGTDDNNTLLGGAGNDTLIGRDGDDSVVGAAGDDLFAEGIGTDTLVGGTGQDTVSMNNLDVRNLGYVLTIDDNGNGTDSFGNEYQSIETYIAGENTDLLGFDVAAPDTITLTDAVEGTQVQDLDGATGIFTPDGAGAGVAFGGPGEPTLGDILSQTYIPPGGTRPLAPKGTYAITGGDESGQIGNITLSNFENINFSVVCFARGTLIRTPNGLCPVEDLCVGDRVEVVDREAQALRWIGSRKLGSADLARHPKLRPVRIEKGALGKGLPEADLTVSPQHRVLLANKVAERIFGTKEVLIAAKKLVGLPGISVVEDGQGVAYFHLLFDRHELVWSNGAVTESLHTGPEALRSLSPEAREEVLTLFPELAREDASDVLPMARPVAAGRKTRSLIRRLEANGKDLVET